MGFFIIMCINFYFFRLVKIMLFFYSSSKLISCIPFPAKFSSRYKLMLPLIISLYYQSIKTGFKFFFVCVS